jgi:hypothetical protein
VSKNGFIKIDKKVPIPPIQAKIHKYPFDKLKPGDSFLFPKGTPRNRASANVHYARMRYNLNFTMRETLQGFRVWRIK